jgi:hypothetical protein
MVKEKFQGWTATLSNGENVWETEPVPNEFTPWRKLLNRLEEENLKITSLRLQRSGITLHALSQKQCDGYYQAMEKHISAITHEVLMVKQGIGSVVGDKIFITWVDDNGNVWMDVRSFLADKTHTTLRNS